MPGLLLLNRRDFRMYNPEGFPREILVDIPKISVSCNLGELLKGKIYLEQRGEVKKEDISGGIIKAEVNGASVTLKLKKLDDRTTEITVSSRKFGLPKSEIASGVVYQITEKLK